MRRNELHFVLEPGYSFDHVFRRLRLSQWTILSLRSGVKRIESSDACLLSDTINAGSAPELLTLSLQHQRCGDKMYCKIKVGEDDIDVKCYPEEPGRVIKGTSIIDVNWYLKAFMDVFRNEDSLGRVRSAVWHWEWTFRPDLPQK